MKALVVLLSLVAAFTTSMRIAHSAEHHDFRPGARPCMEQDARLSLQEKSTRTLERDTGTNGAQSASQN